MQAVVMVAAAARIHQMTRLGMELDLALQLQLQHQVVPALQLPQQQQQLPRIQAVNHVQEFGKLLRFPTNAVPVSKPNNHMKANTTFSYNERMNFIFLTDEFRSKVACENDIAQIECNPYSRIAVYSASFGRTEYESIQCPQPQGVKEESKYFTYF